MMNDRVRDWIGAVSDEWNEQWEQQPVVIDEPRVELVPSPSLSPCRLLEGGTEEERVVQNK